MRPRPSLSELSSEGSRRCRGRAVAPIVDWSVVSQNLQETPQLHPFSLSTKMSIQLTWSRYSLTASLEIKAIVKALTRRHSSWTTSDLESVEYLVSSLDMQTSKNAPK